VGKQWITIAKEAPHMADSTGSTETAFADLLAGLWDEFEDLLDAFYGRRSVEPGGGDRLRMKLYGIRERLEQMLSAEPPQPGRMMVTAPQRLALAS
jgi:hypothetical protein